MRLGLRLNEFCGSTTYHGGWLHRARLEVMAVTATSTQSAYARIMERVVDEAHYVLTVLYRMRDEIFANPELFDPDAQERIDEAIARIQTGLRSARLELTIGRVEQEVKAA
jgi:hypothetical protein